MGSAFRTTPQCYRFSHDPPTMLSYFPSVAVVVLWYLHQYPDQCSCERIVRLTGCFMDCLLWCLRFTTVEKMVAINRKRIQGPSRRNHGTLNKERMGILSLALLAILFLLSSSTTPTSTILFQDQHVLEEATSCELCDSCGLWFAASTLDPNEFGLYAGKARSANEHVAEPDLLSKCLPAVFRSFNFLVVLAFPVVLRLAPSCILIISYAYTHFKNSTTIRRQL
jgi:hypothetical protein